MDMNNPFGLDFSGLQSYSSSSTPNNINSLQQLGAQSTPSQSLTQAPTQEPSRQHAAMNENHSMNAEMTPNQMQNIMMMQMMGRQDLANQMLKNYGMSLPEEDSFTKWKNVFTGTPDTQLSGVQSGIQSSIPLLTGLYGLISRYKYLTGNPSYMTNLAASQIAPLQAAAGFKK
jgi:hypothetical protein